MKQGSLVPRGVSALDGPRGNNGSREVKPESQVRFLRLLVAGIGWITSLASSRKRG